MHVTLNLYGSENLAGLLRNSTLRMFTIDMVGTVRCSWKEGDAFGNTCNVHVTRCHASKSKVLQGLVILYIG